MTAQYIYLIIFFCLGYLIVTDESIAKAVFFISRIVRNKFEMFKWIVIHHPKTPCPTNTMHRPSMKIAEQLKKNINEKNHI